MAGIAELRIAFWFVLRLLIDTSAWLDMATRREGQKWIVPLRVLKSQGRLELLVPALVLEEFDHNRPRSESAVTTSVLDRLRQLRRELREYAGDKHEHIWLAETAQHIPLVNATAPQNFREIDELLRAGTILEPADPEYARAVQRGLDKRAPFTSDKNSVAGRCSSRSTQHWTLSLAAVAAAVAAFFLSLGQRAEQPQCACCGAG